MVDVALVLPPIIESGLGDLYPSTAVLAAHLSVHGHRSRQLDLNNRFVDHLLDPAEVELAAAAAFDRSDATSAAAARWVRTGLVSGRLTVADFAPERVHGDVGLRNVRRALTVPFTVDPEGQALDGRDPDAELTASLDRYFTQHLDDLGGADLVGVSVPMGPQLLPALRLARVLGQRTRVILGGPALSLLAEDDLSRLLSHNPSVDGVVRYDGEPGLLALVEQLAAGRWEPHQVPSVLSRLGDVVVHVPPGPGPRANDLATPTYAAELIESVPTARLGLTQARGCYWGRCDYCDFVEVYEGSPRYRGRRPERVVEDIRRLVETTGCRHYRLITESIPPAFSRRFAELLIDADLDVGWSSFIMVDRRFDRDLLRSIAEAGCDYLVVGLESMVTRVLRHVHKSADREENIRFLREAHDAGIALSVNLIPDLPTTTYDEAMAGLDDLHDLAECFTEVAVLRFETTRSSRVGRDPEAFGLVPVAAPRPRGTTQLAVNEVSVVDPAMTHDQWTEVVAAYEAFSVEVNAARAETQRVRGRSYYASLQGPDGPALIDFATMRVGQLTAH